MKLKDKRMETTNEIFNGIKFIKQNAWEDIFYEKVIHRRKKEQETIQTIYDIGSFNIGFFWMMPNLVTVTVFLLYTYQNN